MITLSHSIEQGVDIVGINGRLTASDAESVSDQLHQILEIGKKNLTIDMTKLEFVDSSGLSVLICTLKAARSGGGDMVLLNVNPRIMTLLELTRLNEIINIYDNQENLIRSFQ